MAEGRHADPVTAVGRRRHRVLPFRQLAPAVAVVTALVTAGCAGQAPGSSGGSPETGLATTGPSKPPSPATASVPEATATTSAPKPALHPGTGDKAPAATAPAQEPAAAPDRLIVPTLGLDERLIDLGLTADGSMEVPQDPSRVGWFTGGGRPGGRGPTVLAGHVDSDRGPAVFFRLTELRPGDVVELRSADGLAVTYVVDQAVDYAKGEFPTEKVFGATREDQLRLITCTGPWDSLAASYSDNRVVYATARG